MYSPIIFSCAFFSRTKLFISIKKIVRVILSCSDMHLVSWFCTMSCMIKHLLLFFNSLFATSRIIQINCDFIKICLYTSLVYIIFIIIYAANGLINDSMRVFNYGRRCSCCLVKQWCMILVRGVEQMWSKTEWFNFISSIKMVWLIDWLVDPNPPPAK